MKQKAGKSQRGSLYSLTNSSLGTHHSMTIASPRVQEKNQAQIRRVQTGYASTPAICLGNKKIKKKKKEKSLPRQLLNSAARARAQPCRAGDLPFPSHSSLPSRLPSSQSFNQLLAAPPPVTLEGGAWLGRWWGSAPGGSWTRLPASPVRMYSCTPIPLPTPTPTPVAPRLAVPHLT